MSVKTQINHPACQTTNNVPAARLDEAPTCGRCGGQLFAGEPLTLTAANVHKTLAYYDIPVVVDCWAEWCDPCKMFAPTFADAARDLEPQFRFAKLDTESEQGLAAQWQIRSIPTLIVFRGGREVNRVGREPGSFGPGWHRCPPEADRQALAPI